MQDVSEDEAAIVELVRDFVDRDVKPIVRDLDTRTYIPRSSSSR
jgi:hypothetical protein